MHIAVVSLWTKEIERYALPVNTVRVSYCQKQKYPLITVDHNLDPTRHPAWSKLKLIQQVLPDYDYVFWNDADCVIFDHSIRIESFIDPQALFHVAFDGQPHWRHPSTKYVSPGINTGNMLIKNTPETFDWLDRIYNQADSTHWFHTPCWEQSGFEQLYAASPEFQKVVKIMSPFDVWNGENGSFLKHALGLHQSADEKCVKLLQYVSLLNTKE